MPQAKNIVILFFLALFITTAAMVYLTLRGGSADSLSGRSEPADPYTQGPASPNIRLTP